MAGPPAGGLALSPFLNRRFNPETGVGFITSAEWVCVARRTRMRVSHCMRRLISIMGRQAIYKGPKPARNSRSTRSTAPPLNRNTRPRIHWPGASESIGMKPNNDVS